MRDSREEAGVDAAATERRLHVVDDSPDLQLSIGDRRHRVVVVAEVLGVAQLVRMRGVRRLGQVALPAGQHLLHRAGDHRIVELNPQHRRTRSRSWKDTHRLLASILLTFLVHIAHITGFNTA